MFAPGSTTTAWHDMTAVRPAWRGRGIASALKRATIAWAIANGLEALETGNDEANAPDARRERSPSATGRSRTTSRLQGPLPPA